ncbi:MAG: Ribosomal large subunit pseudouridine synthase C [Holosporales bacterium]
MANTIMICDQDQIRLDRYLRRIFNQDIPQSVLQKALRTGKIKVNGKKSQAQSRLNHGDEVSVFMDFSTYEVEKKQIPVLSKEDRAFLDRIILFEDDDICVINKPTGLAVQGGSGTKRHLDGMLSQYKKNTKFHLVHRLDKDTSGILVLAKSPQVAHELTELFKTKQVAKTYLAVVHGSVKPVTGTIDAPLLKDFKDKKEIVMVSAKGKPAQTGYIVLKKINRYSIIELSPITGRTHQLRVHMAHIGHPIVGDFKYGSTAEDGMRLHLHAASITFPIGRVPVTFRAPYPTDQLFSNI